MKSNYKNTNQRARKMAHWLTAHVSITKDYVQFPVSMSAAHNHLGLSTGLEDLVPVVSMITHTYLPTYTCKHTHHIIKLIFF